MAVLLSLSAATYSPQVFNLPFAVAADVTRVTVTLTHANTLLAWPDGTLLRLEWDWGSGSTGQFSTSGGLRMDKLGLPVVGNVDLTFSAAKAVGVTAGTLRVTVVQALTAAVLVEGV